jgi:hypothetical protein
MGIVTVIAIISTRSKWQSARRIFDAQRRGAFKDLNKPENKFRYRRFATFALIGSLGMMVSIASLILPQVRQTKIFGIVVIMVVIFGIIGSVAGALMQREIDRRL